MKTRMTAKRKLFAPVALLCGVLIFAACAASPTSTTGNNTSKLATATTAPTATPKPAPAAVPPITLALCQSIMTVDQANQIMNPSTPAVRIDVDNNAPEGGSCNYDYGQIHVDLAIIFQAWHGPNPIPQSDIDATLNEAIQKLGAQGATFSTAVQVSGVGDQAAFVAITFPGNSFISKADVFYVLHGKVFFTCTNYFDVGSTPDATEMSELQQCAQHVVAVV